jgi:hypothetical protein
MGPGRVRGTEAGSHSSPAMLNFRFISVNSANDTRTWAFSSMRFTSMLRVRNPRRDSAGRAIQLYGSTLRTRWD